MQVPIVPKKKQISSIVNNKKIAKHLFCVYWLHYRLFAIIKKLFLNFVLEGKGQLNFNSNCLTVNHTAGNTSFLFSYSDWSEWLWIYISCFFFAFWCCSLYVFFFLELFPVTWLKRFRIPIRDQSELNSPKDMFPGGSFLSSLSSLLILRLDTN